jgi:hypothetical protein
MENHFENIFYTWKTSRVADDVSGSALTCLETLHILGASGAHTRFIYTVTDIWCFPHFVTPLLCLAVGHRFNTI